MTLVHPADATVHAMHGSTFTSYVSPTRGSEQLCAWQLETPADTTGVGHVVSHEEVLLVLAGELRAVIDGTEVIAEEGDVVRVPAGANFRADAGPGGLTAWVVTSVGLHARTADGQRISPPWVR